MSEMAMKKLSTAIWNYDDEMMSEAVDTALNEGISVDDIRRALVDGLEESRHKLMSNALSIPDFLLSIDTMKNAFRKLSSLVGGGKVKQGDIPLVIGVVEGDPHDMGKDIIAEVYRIAGYRVIDLGREVPKESFVKSVQENNAAILALSAMMSTTMVKMQDIIQEVKAKYPDTAIMVGGAALDETIARSYGADGYAESAVTVIEETTGALKEKRKERIGSAQNEEHPREEKIKERGERKEEKI